MFERLGGFPILKRLLEGLVKSPVRHVVLEVSRHCDSRCISCDTWKTRGHHAEDLTRTQQKEALSRLAEAGCRSVSLHGGEPLLCPHLSELVEHASLLGMRTTITTNSLSMTPQRAKRLVDAGLDGIRFSLDGSEEDNNYLRGRKYAFQKTVQAISYVQGSDTSGRVEKIIRTNVCQRNLPRIEEVLDIAHDTGIRRVQITYYSFLDDDMLSTSDKIFQEPASYGRFQAPDELRFTDPEQIEDRRQVLKDKASKLGIELDNTNFMRRNPEEIVQLIKHDNLHPCRMLDSNKVVDTTGVVMPCEFIRFPLGNMKQQSLQEIFTGSRRTKFFDLYRANYRKLSICRYCCWHL